MSKTTCSIDGCDRPLKTRGWCQGHYMRWWHTGDVGTGAIKHYDSTRICQVDGCEGRHAARGYCAPHHKRFMKYGTPGTAAIRPRTVGDAANYVLVHQRLKKKRGRAAAHPCAACGDPARQWAYDHADPDEKIDERGYAFSVNLEHYKPMCASCHKRFDLERLGPYVMRVLGEN